MHLLRRLAVSRTSQSKKLVSNKDGRLILRLVEGILSPVPQKLLHLLASVERRIRTGPRRNEMLRQEMPRKKKKQYRKVFSSAAWWDGGMLCR